MDCTDGHPIITDINIKTELHHEIKQEISENFTNACESIINQESYESSIHTTEQGLSSDLVFKGVIENDHKAEMPNNLQLEQYVGEENEKYNSLQAFSERDTHSEEYQAAGGTNIFEAQNENLEENVDPNVEDVEFECKKCSEKFDCKIKYEDHVVFCTVGKFPDTRKVRIKERNKKLTRNRKINCKLKQKKGVKRNRKAQFKCEICERCFSTKSSLKNHKRMHLFICEVCGNSFTRLSSLMNHKRMHVNTCKDFRINEFGKLVKDVTVANDPIFITPDNDEVKKAHECFICKISFARLGALKSHLLIHDYHWDSLSFQCDNCGNDAFTNYYALLTHKKKCGGMKKTVVKSEDTENHEVSNSEFNKVFVPKKRKFKCKICQRGFPTVQKLISHQYIHNRPHLCEVCQISMPNIDALNEHRVQNHSDVNPMGYKHRCEICAKSFSTVNGLREHMTTHGIGRAKTYWCKLCKPYRKYSTRQGLVIHTRTHTGERPFSCTMCDKSFRDGGTLRKHLFTHSGKRPWVCAMCNKSFTEKFVLREHLRWIHFMKNKSTYESNSCPLCLSVFKNIEEILSHLIWHATQVIDSREFSMKYLKSPLNPVIKFATKRHAVSEIVSSTEQLPSIVRKSCRLRKPSIKVRDPENINWEDEHNRQNVGFVDEDNLCSENFDLYNNEKVVSPKKTFKKSRKPKGFKGFKNNYQNNFDIPFSHTTNLNNSNSEDDNVEILSVNPNIEVRDNEIVSSNNNEDSLGITKNIVNFVSCEIRSDYILSEMETACDIKGENTCDMCGESFETRSHLVDHVKIHI